MRIMTLLVIGMVMLGSSTQGQQIFRISQFSQHNFLYNPAAAGASPSGSVGAAYRKMWSGMPGGPQTSFLYFDNYFSKKKAGLAVVIYDDKTGPTSRTGGELNLSYSIELDTDSRLMLGLGGQVLQYRIDKDEIAKYIPNDPLLMAEDSKVTGDASAGVYLKTKKFNLGISVKQLIQSKLDFIQGNQNPEGRLYRHYYLVSDYTIKADEDNTLIPNVVVRYLPNSPVEFQGGVTLDHKDMLMVGLSYMYKQNFSAFAGVKIDHKLAIGYSFDVYKTPLSVFDDGGTAHEISLRYFFKK